MKKLIAIIMTLVTIVLSLTASATTTKASVTSSVLENPSPQFFWELVDNIEDTEDCYVYVNLNPENKFQPTALCLALVLFGPETEKMSELYIYNQETCLLVKTEGWAHYSDDLISALERVGIHDPFQYFIKEDYTDWTGEPKTFYRLDPFALLSQVFPSVQ